ncbi:hypothetical protein AB0F11_13285 [Streptomyces sp. NPDC032472]|uniref:hypothetical protein n=1 Tax=Streptomyces sp. NPDC032472 TaxID=3155018 RepID=UPI0033DCA95B
MDITPYRLGAVLLTLLVLPAPTTAFADPAPVPARHRHSAEEISAFLTSFYGHHGPSEHDREQKVSQQLKDRQGQSRYVDVLLCARSDARDGARREPQDIVIGPVTVAQSAKVGWATVTTHWSSEVTDTFTAYVRLDSRPIKIDDVICAG